MITTMTKILGGAALLALTLPGQAVEITPFAEYVFSDDLIIEGTEQNVDVDDTAAFGVVVGWPSDTGGQGQVSLSYGSYDFSSYANDTYTESSFDLLYAHFSGVAEYRQQNYSTTVSFGVGATFIDADQGSSSTYPSLTAALGTRYSLSEQLSLVTELRVYGTFAEDDSTIFCSSNASGSNCIAQFDGSFWVDGALRLGVAYKF
jgi:hypothetical protein